jgi:DNA repair protein RecO (recombination protein O)
MEWSDEAIVLSVRTHGETSSILEALTREHGRHMGLVYGGVSAKRRAVLQPGNSVHVKWRARIAEHLGSYTAEPVRLRAGEIFETRASLIGLNAFVAIAGAVLPEREPHGSAFEGANYLLETISAHGFEKWGLVFARWELLLLDDLGFGLDLSSCAGTGSTENLVYVSPRSGRAVSGEAGEAYHDKLLPLPGFLIDDSIEAPSSEDIGAALALTAYFLNLWVLAPHERRLPEARRRLNDFAAKHAMSLQDGESD